MNNPTQQRGPHTAGAPCRRRHEHGGILLEVVFALALLAAAAGVILGSMTASIHAAQRIKAEADLADVCVTVMSRLQMGLLPLEEVSDQAFEEPRLEGWTYSVKTSAIETGVAGSDLKHVEVTIVSPDKQNVMRSATLIRNPVAGANATNAPAGGGL